MSGCPEGTPHEEKNPETEGLEKAPQAVYGTALLSSLTFE